MPLSNTPMPPGTFVMSPRTWAATNALTVSANGGRGPGMSTHSTATASPQSTIDSANWAAASLGVGRWNSTPKSRIGARAKTVARA